MWRQQDRSFTFILKTPPTAVLLKKAAGGAQAKIACSHKQHVFAVSLHCSTCETYVCAVLHRPGSTKIVAVQGFVLAGDSRSVLWSTAATVYGVDPGPRSVMSLVSPVTAATLAA